MKYKNSSNAGNVIEYYVMNAMRRIMYLYCNSTDSRDQFQTYKKYRYFILVFITNISSDCFKLN